MRKPSKRCVPTSYRKLRTARARRHLLDFIKFTMPEYLAGWFAEELCWKLEIFLEQSIAGLSPRLIVMAPPRHGKSQIVSRHFPAFGLGKYPDMGFIATSYASDLASSMNRDVQRVIDSDEYHILFPATTLWGKNIRTVADGSYLRNSDIFEIVNRKGVYKSAGVGAGVTGRGGHVLLIDDPIKDDEEAHSEVVREKIWNWFTSTLSSRQAPGAGIVLIMTRWHEDDLAGRLIARMKNGGEHWDILCFPAIAEHDEYSAKDGRLLRREGEALHPERYTLDMLLRIKMGTEDETGCGSRVWNSLYQQRPSAAEGNIFNKTWWKFLRPHKQPIDMGPSERKAYFHELGILRIIQRFDTALGEKKQNDYTSCVTLGIARNRYYVIDVWKDKIQFPEVKKTVQLMFDRWHPSRVYIEGGGSASGKATVQAMKRDSRVPIFETITSTDKVLRADTVSPSCESGFVTILEGGEWCQGFIDSCAKFPNAKNDDDVDAFIGAMEVAIHKGAGMHISDDFLAAIGA